MSPQAAALVPTLVLVAAVGFDVHCLRELARAEVTLYFTPDVWRYLIVLFTPFGGAAYLMLGRPS